MRILALLAVLLMMTPDSRADENVKQPGLAGSWYPGDRAPLKDLVDGYFAAALPPVPDGDVGIVISPHAGLMFSGPVAAWGFKAAQAQKISTVIILAPSHLFSFSGASVWAKGAFVTPLGTLLIDEDLAGRLLAAEKVFTFRRDVFEGERGRAENSVETQLPFIQTAFPNAKIVPIIMGNPPDARTAQQVARALADAVGERTDVLLDVSVDQSHYHPDAEAREIDQAGLDAIMTFDVPAFWDGHVKGRMEVDGFHVVATAMLYAQARGYDRPQVLRHATSADVSRDTSSVVGYASIIFKRKAAAAAGGLTALSAAQKQRLVGIARSTLDTFVKTGRVPPLGEVEPRLQAPEGAFVTLKVRGQLRGCIGHIIADGPLATTVRDMAVAAASQDPRFSPVRPEELKDIDVEVSVLSRPVAVRGADEVVLGRHGVIISRGGHGGVFLPQVAAETGWSKERFMAELCSQKAGLPPDCWKDPATRIEVFTADVFGERS